jgi:hypothetical protein
MSCSTPEAAQPSAGCGASLGPTFITFAVCSALGPGPWCTRSMGRCRLCGGQRIASAKRGALLARTHASTLRLRLGLKLLDPTDGPAPGARPAPRDARGDASGATRPRIIYKFKTRARISN